MIDDRIPQTMAMQQLQGSGAGQMSDQRIMYVCGPCSEEFVEACGHFNRNDLRMLPDGKWVCDGCFDDTTQADRGNLDEEEYLSWSDMPVPPEYSPADRIEALEEQVAWWEEQWRQQAARIEALEAALRELLELHDSDHQTGYDVEVVKFIRAALAPEQDK